MKLKMILAACLMSTAAMAQTDPIVMTVNGVDVTRSEFEYSFNKNNSDGVIDKKNVEEYADLYAVYKMKVAAAIDARLDTLTSFKNEFATYRDQQVLPTMTTDAEVVAEARKAYDRAKEQIGEKGLILPAHIFLRVSTKATSEERILLLIFTFLLQPVPKAPTLPEGIGGIHFLSSRSPTPQALSRSYRIL